MGCVRLRFAVAASLLLFMVACQTTPKKEKAIGDVISVEKNVAPILPPLDPMVIQASSDLQLACQSNSQLKSRAESLEICGCIVRNHEHRLPAAELQSLVKKYRAGRKGMKPRTVEEGRLFEYDFAVASECVKNPGYLVPEEP